MTPKRDMSEKEFNEWKEQWLRGKGCPFFTCSQAMFRNTCGSSHLCGVLFDYNKYKTKKWIKECDVPLPEDPSGNLPTKICTSCLGSMSLKIDQELNEMISESWCPLMNNFYQQMGYTVDRTNEKYIMSQGAWLIPFIGEDAYLEIIKDPEKLKEILSDRNIDTE